MLISVTLLSFLTKHYSNIEKLLKDIVSILSSKTKLLQKDELTFEDTTCPFEMLQLSVKKFKAHIKEEEAEADDDYIQPNQIDVNSHVSYFMDKIDSTPKLLRKDTVKKYDGDTRNRINEFMTLWFRGIVIHKTKSVLAKIIHDE
jgi:hypothetical protein